MLTLFLFWNHVCTRLLCFFCCNCATSTSYCCALQGKWRQLTFKHLIYLIFISPNKDKYLFKTFFLNLRLLEKVMAADYSSCVYFLLTLSLWQLDSSCVGVVLHHVLRFLPTNEKKYFDGGQAAVELEKNIVFETTCVKPYF